MDRYETKSQLLAPDVTTSENHKQYNMAFAGFVADVMGIFQHQEQLSQQIGQIYNSMWTDLDRKPTSIEISAGMAYAQIIKPLTGIMKARYLHDPDMLYQMFYDGKVGSELFLETTAAQVRNMLSQSDGDIFDIIGDKGNEILNLGYATICKMRDTKPIHYSRVIGETVDIKRLRIEPDPRTQRIMYGVDLTHQYMLNIEEMTRQTL